MYSLVQQYGKLRWSKNVLALNWQLYSKCSLQVFHEIISTPLCIRFQRLPRPPPREPGVTVRGSSSSSSSSFVLALASSSLNGTSSSSSSSSSAHLDGLSGDADLTTGGCPFLTAAGGDGAADDVEYLYLVPILFVLGLNTFFLVWIMYVVITKLRATQVRNRIFAGNCFAFSYNSKHSPDLFVLPRRWCTRGILGILLRSRPHAPGAVFTKECENIINNDCTSSLELEGRKGPAGDHPPPWHHLPHHYHRAQRKRQHGSVPRLHTRQGIPAIYTGKIDTPVFQNNKLLTYFPPFKPGLRGDAALLLPEHGDPKRGSVSLGALPDNQVGKTG